jgi:uncharacterized protein
MPSRSPRPPPFRASASRASASSGTATQSSALLEELRGLYRRIDTELDGFGCDASTDCCRFGVTGREPYPTAIELAELERAVRARGGLPKRRSLPVVTERRCTLLGDDGRCLVYAARPYGCRTFFCERARGPAGEPAVMPRGAVREIATDIASLSARFAPADPGARPLSRAMRDWEALRGGRKRSGRP